MSGWAIFCAAPVGGSLFLSQDLLYRRGRTILVGYLHGRELGIRGHIDEWQFVSRDIHLVTWLELVDLVDLIAVERIANLFDDRPIRQQMAEIKQHFPLVIAKA